MKIQNIHTHPYAFVTVAELGEYCHLDRATIRRHIAKGALEAVVIGDRSVRIPIQAARAYAAGTPACASEGNEGVRA